MIGKTRLSMGVMTFVLVLALSAMWTVPARADDGTPQPPDVPAVSQGTSDAPVAQDAPAVLPPDELLGLLHLFQRDVQRLGNGFIVAGRQIVEVPHDDAAGQAHAPACEVRLQASPQDRLPVSPAAVQG